MSIKKSYLAGIMIGLGGLVNLVVGDWLGALLFATGLLAICINGYQLVTGRFGLLYTGEITIVNIIFMFIFNMFGTATVALCRTFGGDLVKVINNAYTIYLARVAQPWYIHITLGILCGICI